NQTFEKVRAGLVVRIEDAHDFGGGIRMPQCIVERAAFCAGKTIDVKEPKPWAELPAMLFDRPPQGRVLCIVVNDEYFEVRILHSADCIQGPDHDIGRLRITRHVKGYAWPGTNVAG